jgi:TolB-like protein
VAPAAGAWPTWRWWWIALPIAVALTIALVASTQPSKAPGRTKELSIVILPLVAESGGEDTQAFADVLHSDLTHAVSHFENSFVIGRGTAATYRGRVVDPRTVAGELHVRHVVSGSLRRDGDQIRLALALSDGETGVQRWTDVFEVERPKLGQALDEVVAKLARALYIHAWKSEFVRADALSPSQVTAEDMATRAWGLWFRGLNQDNVLAMLSLAEKAVAVDADSARGWGAIAVANVQSLNNNWFVGPEARRSALRRAEQASAALDRLAPDGFSAMQARVIDAYNREDFPAMLQRARLWVELHPDPIAYGGLGEAQDHTDQPEAAITSLERALRLSPFDPFRAEWMYRLAWSHYIPGDLDEALDWARKAEATNPRLPWPPVQAAALLQLGRRGEAQASWDEFHRRHPSYDRAAILHRLSGDFPRYAAARGRLIQQLSALGMK